MALVHNTFIRALNSIYLHAPLIAASNKSLSHDLLSYCQCWVALVALHHQTEEKFLFSAFEKRIPGAKGILDMNVHQHEEFHDGLAAFEKYVDSALAGKELYDSERLLKLIDSFSEPLMKHFNDEIATLMRLEEAAQGSEVMKVHEEFEVIVRKDVDAVGFLLFFLATSPSRLFYVDLSFVRLPLNVLTYPNRQKSVP
jgi:hemerythrin-like domain-containing protein